MKKTTFFLSLLGIFCIPFLVSASSGACSWHGGVNCSAGADYDGSVICNDGWRDSFVSYSNIAECNQSHQSQCVPTYLYLTGCKTEAEVSGIIAWALRNSGLGYSSVTNANIKQCQKEIDEYNIAYQAYQQCLSQASSASSYNPTNYNPTPSCPANASAIGISCYCNAGYQINSAKNGCVSICPDFSTYNPNTKQCDCVDGDIKDGGQCIYGQSYCEKYYNKDYDFDRASKTCILNAAKALANRGNECTTSYGNGSFYDNGDKVCKCYQGYTMADNKCIKGEDYCKSKYGQYYTYAQNLDKCNYNGPAIEGNVLGANNSQDSTSTEAVNKVFYSFAKDLKVGSRGGDVKELQNFLIKNKILKIKATDYFGAATKSALLKYQKSIKVKQTGKLDKATRDYINKLEK